MRSGDFDFVAPFYDLLARIVFGDALKRSQCYFLNAIKEGDAVLIIGGGTGGILMGLDRLNVPVNVTYVEHSAKMLKISKQHQLKHIEVKFIHGTEANIPKASYDVVITAFFLDVFNAQKLPVIMDQIHQNLTFSGRWLQTDFVKTSKVWQRIMIRAMYLFFRLATGMEGRRLLNFDEYFDNLGYKKITFKHFYYGMVRTTLYQAG
ncbi:methyltransferase [Fulvivirga sp. M361]|uniref:class I SAM-dependent methyltransferase n=1 Tax=Fulvivirga sp. M361 TaxID=2594266 RepID=UPI00117B74C9|nr:methyltransferase domain-containing protein [Fulvivirga sp. M361]TRX53673.1 methyltransferase [Fulvivirga sp. M361]